MITSEMLLEIGASLGEAEVISAKFNKDGSGEVLFGIVLDRKEEWYGDTFRFAISPDCDFTLLEYSTDAALSKQDIEEAANLDWAGFRDGSLSFDVWHWIKDHIDELPQEIRQSKWFL